MHHIGTQVLSTERLTLRPFTLADAPAMFRNWASDPEVTRYLTWPTHPDVETSEKVLKEWVALYREPDFYQWAIVPKDYGEPIGSIAAVRVDNNVQSVHIGYCIGRRWWRQGYTSEAMQEMLRFFFEEVGVNRIDSRHDPRNPYSGRVMVHCGMRREGTIRQGDTNNQGLCDYVLYGILAEDYHNLSPKPDTERTALIHQGTKTLETDRLILRPFTTADASAMYRNWGSDSEVNIFMTWPLHKSEADSRAVLETWTAQYSQSDFYNWAIVLKSVGEPIGGISVVRMNEATESAEVGYCIGHPWWHQGLTSEALATVLRFLFVEVGFNRVEARHDPRNPNSGRVMAHCGMTREGTLRQIGRNNQGRCDSAMYGMLAEEYLQQSSGR